LSHHLVTGTAGFIGSHLTDRLLHAGHCVSGIDNFLRGHRDNLRVATAKPGYHFIEGDVSTAEGALAAFETAARGEPIDTVWHMAANSDLLAGANDPTVDLRHTFLTTYHVLGAMRRLGIPELAFPSSSAIDGVHAASLADSTGPLFPISNYGAMKLASEAIISASLETFLKRAWLFRFPNVVGGLATQGIIFDLIGKLRRSRAELEVLGNGTQEKPYLHVSELIDALLFIVDRSRERLNCFNISSDDDGCTLRSIAETVVRAAAPGTPIRYGTGNQGWPGDAPRFSYATEKLAALCWRPKLSSTEAIELTTREICNS